MALRRGKEYLVCQNPLDPPRLHKYEQMRLLQLDRSADGVTRRGIFQSSTGSVSRPLRAVLAWELDLASNDPKLANHPVGQLKARDSSAPRASVSFDSGGLLHAFLPDNPSHPLNTFTSDFFISSIDRASAGSVLERKQERDHYAKNEDHFRQQCERAMELEPAGGDQAGGSAQSSAGDGEIRDGDVRGDREVLDREKETSGAGGAGSLGDGAVSAPAGESFGPEEKKQGSGAATGSASASGPVGRPRRIRRAPARYRPGEDSGRGTPGGASSWEATPASAEPTGTGPGAPGTSPSA